MAPYEALYGTICCSSVGWLEPGEARLLGTDLVYDALKKVKVRDVAYMVGEKVLLRVSPTKGVMRFRKKGKLSPQYIGHFDVLEMIGEVASKLALPPSLSGVHPVFHVSMLRKYYGDPSHILDFSIVQLDENLTYDVELVAFLDRRAWKLRSKNIA
ncbi:uncharacterized protein [Nicotiana tomentosiformis]|uniref:uncharacterized protein n=1 Tax=Nicotiana tomentosiformis TaxID=4098 RepID=UPI00388C5D75